MFAPWYVGFWNITCGLSYKYGSRDVVEFEYVETTSTTPLPRIRTEYVIKAMTVNWISCAVADLLCANVIIDVGESCPVKKLTAADILLYLSKFRESWPPAPPSLRSHQRANQGD